ncbi:HTH-type transcriptional regulator BetI [BD1-7 clade bacterium]|uniref:HTH-type transcriptional regulator BetI n=1 Tax=BD1-7 clade bacterium TaxID=2029982 RepID=A0A5S9QIC7_9GAMM|nr:HTH-type transcriptional regulator BetI [BD1-7 clade bacterium]CAA0117662.1 HTH-type transcriptional regulator BetI [BD1-7 clade bacterium]
MSATQPNHTSSNVQERLISAAFDLFMHHDYNKVTTRQLAETANTSLSSINYYFGDKQTLYNEMVRQQFSNIESALKSSFTENGGINFELLMMSYHEAHQKNPHFPAFFTRILAFKDGPGYLLLANILDHKRELLGKMIASSQRHQGMRDDVDLDVLRIIMMSLSVFPYLIRDVIHTGEQTDADDALMANIAHCAGELLGSCLYKN